MPGLGILMNFGWVSQELDLGQDELEELANEAVLPCCYWAGPLDSSC